MKLFGWVQNKLNGSKQANRKSNAVPTKNYYAKQEHREEFSDWPQGLFSIGTFGNDDIKEITESQNINNIQEENNPSWSEEVLDITPEEVGKLQKELTKLLSRKPNKEKEISELPLDRFLNCPSSLEVDRRISNALCCSESDNHDDHNYDDKDDEDIDKTISVIIGKCKEVLISAERNKKAIGKKSISFLLKKMFVCRSGFAPAPSLRDTLQESRMEKLLRTMLHKKMSHQNSYRASSVKKYLEDNPMTKKKNDQDKTAYNELKKKNDQDETTHDQKTDDGGKWVKTDSEYIVLEI
ncbi:uncharacterized protein LOC112094565 [Morus notabilis]|uniref:uncharacterized protein LOC112094565 n=1 Tax=Morus notabilis TaxID=981085 RepID=UPI000CECEE58|nr:uncharacterized protein LOC112094565 [Morus notabilis]